MKCGTLQWIAACIVSINGTLMICHFGFSSHHTDQQKPLSFDSLRSDRGPNENQHGATGNEELSNIPTFLVRTKTQPPFEMMTLTKTEDNVVSYEIISNGFYTADISNLMYSIFQRDPCKGRLFVDAGANLGYYTLMALANGCRVISFEPQKLAAAMIRMSVSANRFEKSTLINAALGEFGGETVFMPRVMGNLGGSSASHTQNCAEENNGLHYKQGSCSSTVKMDDHIQEPIFILKIDVEGHEANAFAGASRIMEKFSPEHIVMEYRPNQIDIVKSIIKHRNYQAFNVREWSFFGQDGNAVYNISRAPTGLVDWASMVPITLDNVDDFNAQLSARSCTIGCFTDLYFRRSPPAR
jgi:FkbM family methyltransferase